MNSVERIRVLMDSIGRSIRLMEVCGTHTVVIFRHGIRDLLPEDISLLSGPGCPVCVTAIKDIETAIAISRQDGFILTTFGDMMRVPGGQQSLYDVRAEGADIRIVYSPLDALKIASENKDKKVVFFATGFETTAPSVAGTILQAETKNIENFYIYSAHKLVPPALNALLDSDSVNVNGFILPGHVSTIIGSRPYEFIATKYKKASVITGFDADDVLQGIIMLLEQITSGRADVEIQYKRVVKEQGNPKALSLINEYFEPCNAYWRGIGLIPKSGLRLRDKFMQRDIKSYFEPAVPDYPEPKACSCGEVLRGIKIPTDCLLFGKTCTPDKPVGACMVSTEGSCAAYYKYGMYR
ncbi:MAG: hydrogenase formation protein HypD [Nitrospirota bacterium]